ncbi:MAG TPA: cation:proton antiporter [Gaiellaceae bacterium]|nr:cation:proton antiporter [Gaiellaceae bacterium]
MTILAPPFVAAVTAPPVDLGSLTLVLAAATLGALLSRFHGRIALPTVVLEIVFGIAIGPQVLGIAKVDPYINFLSNLGLGMLFFLAGLEVIEKKIPRRAVRTGTIGWLVSLAIALVVGLVLQEAGLNARWWLIGVALATTALGTLVPMLSDAGLLPTPLGAATLGTGVAGEFWPIVFISIFLTGVYGAATEVVLLIVFCGVVAFAALAAMRARPPRVVRAIQATVHTTGQAAVRGSMLILAALVYLAVQSGFDFVLGAFAAGLVVGLALDTPSGEGVRVRLEGIGFGVFVPIYFVVTGMTFDLDSLLTRGGLALAGLFLALFMLTRGSSALLWRKELGEQATAGLAFFAATGLPLIVAIVSIGEERGAIDPSVGASLVGAGMLSVLIYPMVAIHIVGRREPSGAEAEEFGEFAEEFLG